MRLPIPPVGLHHLEFDIAQVPFEECPDGQGLRRTATKPGVNEPIGAAISRNLSPPSIYKPVPKLCPKYVRNIKTYLIISNSIEILDPKKIGLLQGKSFIFCAFASDVAAYTR
jgi:hypothetical protein